MANGAVCIATEHTGIAIQSTTLTRNDRVCGMVANTAKSRSSANQNMANRLIHLEQAHHLRYVLPTDPLHQVYTGMADANVPGDHHGADANPTHSLVQGLINNIASTDQPEHPTIATDHFPSFTSPARRHTFTDAERHSLARDIRRTGTSGQAVSMCDLPTTCIRWAGILCQDAKTQKIVRVVSTQMRRGDSKRSNAIVRFEHQKPGYLDIVSAFGQVEFFFQLPPFPEYPDGIHVAYIRTFHVGQDGRLVYIARDGAMEMVVLQDIKELMGLFVWDSQQYLMNSVTSLLV
jgi:hypothetical protein